MLMNTVLPEKKEKRKASYAEKYTLARTSIPMKRNSYCRAIGLANCARLDLTVKV